MSFEHEKRIASRLLQTLEDGTLSTADQRMLFEDADPVLVHVIFAWLRNRYGAGYPASEGVLGRMVDLCRASPAVAKKAREGESDPIVEWLEETFEYGDLDRVQLISEVVDKLEG